MLDLPQNYKLVGMGAYTEYYRTTDIDLPADFKSPLLGITAEENKMAQLSAMGIQVEEVSDNSINLEDFIVNKVENESYTMYWSEELQKTAGTDFAVLDLCGLLFDHYSCQSPLSDLYQIEAHREDDFLNFIKEEVLTDEETFIRKSKRVFTSTLESSDQDEEEMLESLVLPFEADIIAKLLEGAEAIDTAIMAIQPLELPLTTGYDIHADQFMLKDGKLILIDLITS